MEMNRAQGRHPPNPNNWATKSPLSSTTLYARPSDEPLRMTIKPGQRSSSTKKSKIPMPTMSRGTKRPAPQDNGQHLETTASTSRQRPAPQDNGQHLTTTASTTRRRPAPQDVKKQRKMNHKVTSMEEGSSWHSSQPKVPAYSFFESVASHMATHYPNVRVSFIDHIEGSSMHEVLQKLNLMHQTTARFLQSNETQESRSSSPGEISPTSGLSLPSRATSTEYEAESQSRREYKEREWKAYKH